MIPIHNKKHIIPTANTIRDGLEESLDLLSGSGATREKYSLSSAAISS